MRKSIVIILALIVVFACSVQAKTAKGGKPQWLQNPKLVYPENRYLTAVGSGDTRSAAEDMAAGNLAKIFEANITADQTVSERYYELMSAEKSEYEQQTNIRKNVNVRSQQTLFNVQFAESYTDNLGQVHVLAYIDRLKTAGIYEEKIADNSTRIKYFVKQAQASSDILQKYAFYSAANVIIARNQTLIQQLAIISPVSKDVLELNYNPQEIKTQFTQTAQKIKFQIEIINDRENKITSLVKEILTDMGFVVGTPPLLKASGSLEIVPTDLKRQNLIFVRYELQLEIIDNNFQTLVTINDKGREGHISETEAEARAVMTIENKIKRELRDKLNSYFDRMILK